MKFTFSTNKDKTHIFHENLFKSSPKSIISDNESDENESDSEYTDEIDLNETNQLQINDLSLPLTGQFFSYKFKLIYYNILMIFIKFKTL